MRNRTSKSTIKSAVKKFNVSLESKDKTVAMAEFTKAQKLLDTAAGKGIMHPNAVARKKSRLAKQLNKLS